MQTYINSAEKSEYTKKDVWHMRTALQSCVEVAGSHCLDHYISWTSYITDIRDEEQ